MHATDHPGRRVVVQRDPVAVIERSSILELEARRSDNPQGIRVVHRIPISGWRKLPEYLAAAQTASGTASQNEGVRRARHELRGRRIDAGVVRQGGVGVFRGSQTREGDRWTKAIEALSVG